MSTWRLPNNGEIIALGVLGNRDTVIQESTDSIRAQGYIRKEAFYLQEKGWESISVGSNQTSNEMTILKENVGQLAEIVMKKKNPIIFELGPGASGKHRVLLDRLEAQGKKTICALVDLNREFLVREVAKSKHYKHITTFGLHGDFDLALQWARRRPASLDGIVVSLGSVLANFEWSEASRNLAKWGKGGVSACDLILGQDAFSPDQSVVYKAYHVQPYFAFIDGGVKLLAKTPAGAPVDDSYWELDHVASSDETRHYFVVKVNKDVKIANVPIKAGTQLEAFSSYKWKPAQMKKMVSDLGLTVKNSWSRATMNVYYIDSA